MPFALPFAQTAVTWALSGGVRDGAGGVVHAVVTDRQIDQVLTELLDRRGRGKTVCPSEAARALAPAGWWELMPRVREAADRLRAAGRAAVFQGGAEIASATSARGPIRIGRRQ